VARRRGMPAAKMNSVLASIPIWRAWALWQKYVASYRKFLDGSPEAFSEFSAQFREKFIRAKPND
jgi:hypothetical protein